MQTSKSTFLTPISFLGKMLDALLAPIMWLVSGRGETGNTTHRWNSIHLRGEVAQDLAYTLEAYTTPLRGNPRALPRKSALDIRFHLPLLGERWGAWTRYAVVVPEGNFSGAWHVGAVIQKGAQPKIWISRLSQEGPVRLLCGPKKTPVFGVAENGTHLRLKVLWYGILGEKEGRHIPLR